jgi:peptide/nickel transport system ATP-binding protein
MTEGPLLAVAGLHIRFGGSDVDAVTDASFTVGEGEVLAVVGESGSGKSVTALATVGLLPADAQVGGSVTFDGEELVGATPRRFARVRGSGISTIFQDPAASLDPVFTIGHQVEASVHRHRPDLARPEQRKVAIELLTQVGIPDADRRFGQYPHQFSGGQLQRIMIAIALAAQPRVLIADEPTTALDVTVQAEIIELLRRLNTEQGTAIILITHDMGVVADMAQRVVVMREGRTIESGPVAQIFRDPQQDYTRALLDAVPTGDHDAVPAGDGSEARAVLEVRDLSIRYRTRFGHTEDVVRGIDLRIGPGEVLGLVGESGSGKTSIARSIVGLAPISGGTVLLDGTDVTSAGRRERKSQRARVGTVFQSPSGSLNPRLSIGASIAEPLRAGGGLTRDQVRNRVGELLDAVRIPTSWQQRPPSALSGGQRQRVGIARALALNPRLLIADEPTSALDVSVQAEVLDLLRGLQEELQFGCLFISHDLFVVREMCEHVIVLRNGHIVERGRTEKVLTDPTEDYTRLLILSAPVADPDVQRVRREKRLAGAISAAG